MSPFPSGSARFFHSVHLLVSYLLWFQGDKVFIRWVLKIEAGPEIYYVYSCLWNEWLAPPQNHNLNPIEVRENFAIYSRETRTLLREETQQLLAGIIPRSYPVLCYSELTTAHNCLTVCGSAQKTHLSKDTFPRFYIINANTKTTRRIHQRIQVVFNPLASHDSLRSSQLDWPVSDAQPAWVISQLGELMYSEKKVMTSSCPIGVKVCCPYFWDKLIQPWVAFSYQPVHLQFRLLISTAPGSCLEAPGILPESCSPFCLQWMLNIKERSQYIFDCLSSLNKHLGTFSQNILSAQIALFTLRMLKKSEWLAIMFLF